MLSIHLNRYINKLLQNCTESGMNFNWQELVLDSQDNKDCKALEERVSDILSSRLKQCNRGNNF